MCSVSCHTYTFYTYINKPPCDYIDMNYPNIAVSPFPNYLLNSIILGSIIKILSTLFKIFVLGAPEYTWLVIYIVTLSSTYVITKEQTVLKTELEVKRETPINSCAYLFFTEILTNAITPNILSL